MSKFCKTINILVSLILTLTGLAKLIPPQSQFGVQLKELYYKIGANSTVNSAISYLLIILGIAVLITIVYDIKTAGKRHTFRVGSYWFCRYFKKWYSQTGLLSIICDDLEGWTQPEGNCLIIDALRKKSSEKQLQLFLAKESPSEMIEELRQLGAVINQAPVEIITNYSFSCLSVMGNHSAVIIRNKQMDKSTHIVFEEVSNSYISGLLNIIIKEGRVNV